MPLVAHKTEHGAVMLPHGDVIAAFPTETTLCAVYLIQTCMHLNEVSVLLYNVSSYITTATMYSWLPVQENLTELFCKISILHTLSAGWQNVQYRTDHQFI